MEGKGGCKVCFAGVVLMQDEPLPAVDGDGDQSHFLESVLRRREDGRETKEGERGNGERSEEDQKALAAMLMEAVSPSEEYPQKLFDGLVSLTGRVSWVAREGEKFCSAFRGN